MPAQPKVSTFLARKSVEEFSGLPWGVLSITPTGEILSYDPLHMQPDHARPHGLVGSSVWSIVDTSECPECPEVVRRGAEAGNLSHHVEVVYPWHFDDIVEPLLVRVSFLAREPGRCEVIGTYKSLHDA